MGSSPPPLCVIPGRMEVSGVHGAVSVGRGPPRARGHSCGAGRLLLLSAAELRRDPRCCAASGGAVRAGQASTGKRRKGEVALRVRYPVPRR